MAPKSFAADGMDDVMEVDVPPSTLDSEMLSEGSFQLVDQLTEITIEVAMLQNTTKVDLQQSLAELTAAMQQLAHLGPTCGPRYQYPTWAR